MSDVNANIGINFDTANALAQLRQLQAGLSKFNQALTEGNVAAANAQKGLNAQLVQSINSTGKFIASQRNISSSTTAFTEALEKNKLSMGQYFKYTSAAATLNSKMLQGFFTKEKEILTRASKDRVKALQTQYIQLTNANGELVKVLQVVPKHLDQVNGKYTDYATRVQMAAQRQQFLNQLIKQGSTQLLNFGKNTQWAGRQLMVGLTVPLTMLGSAAAKTFKDMEMATVKFQRVYGDMFTANDATNKAVKDIQALGKEFTKFGIAAVDTMNMAADAAAMGLTGKALTTQVEQATKLAVLGQVSQQDALQTTISLQNAFGISSDQLAQKINYLNAVEHQTVLSIEDMTTAIPKAAPVVKQLGGSVEDLAFFLTAMREGGINASEGANALKSSLASIINPSKKASDMLASFGINIKGIADSNAGNLKGTVIGLARALDTLAPLDRARAIETMFGKFQFARISTMFQNITKSGSQAATALGLAGASVEELAILSEREMGKVENAVSVKFQKQMENLKLQLMPLGKAFLQAVTPIVKFASSILEKFNNLSDGTKKFVVGFIAILGGIAPVALMTVGLVANGVANLMKFFGMLRGGMAKLNGQNNVLGGGFDYLTQAETENLAQSQALHASHQDLIATFNVEANSANLLAEAYRNAASQARALASGSPGLFNAAPGAGGAVDGLPPRKFASGGLVPGSGNGDTVPAMLTPGEFVLTKDVVKQNPGIISALTSGKIQKFSEGGLVGSQSGSLGSGKLPGYIQKEYDRIASLSDANLKRYADLTGMGVDHTMDEIRKAVLTNFEQLLKDVKTKTGSLTKEGLEQIGKAPGANGGPSIMGKWFKKFDEGQGGSFAHVGQTEKVSVDEAVKLHVTPEITKQMDIVKKYYEAKGQKAPDVRVADAFGFNMKQNVNRGMASQDQSKFEKKYGTTVGQAFQDDFAKTGSEKWRTMTELVGQDFDKVKGQAEIYDKALLNKVTAWNTENSKKTIPDPFTDDVFLNLEQQVRQDIDGLIPDFKQVIQTAKGTITALRTSIANEDIGPINQQLKTANAGSLGPKGSNAKYGNVEARRQSEVLGTIEVLPKQVEKSLTDAEKAAETQSPSKRTERLGRNIGKGLENGLKQSMTGVQSQAEKLAQSSLPTAAQTTDKVSKMDLGNKAFYDDLKTPELADQRQVLKSIDRRNRKLGASGIVGNPKASTSATASKTSVSIEQSEEHVAKAAEQVAEQSKQEVSLKAKIVGVLKDALKTAIQNKKHEDAIAKSTEDVATAQAQRADQINAENGNSTGTAKTSVALADAQQQHADVTGESVNAAEKTLDEQKKSAKAAKTHAKNTTTAANLENTVAKKTREVSSSVGDISSANDAIANNAQQDQINTQRIKDADAQIAAKKEKLAASIPDGSQTGNNIPSSYVSLEDAQKEAEGFTRDKNGKVLIDPETGAPTTLSQRGLKLKARGMRREAVGKYSGKISGALGTATMVAGAAGAPAPVIAGLGVASTVAAVAPALAGMGPLGWSAAGIGALGLAAIYAKKKFEDMVAAQVKYVDSVSATTAKMKSIGEITGKVGASELYSRKRSEGVSNRYTSSFERGKQQFGTDFLQSDIGKSIKAAFISDSAKQGSEKAAQQLGLQLSAYISDGVLTAEQAYSVARQIGLDLGNMTLGTKIQGAVTELVGPDGKDLLTNPLEIRVKLVTTQQDIVNNATKTGTDFSNNYNAAAGLIAPNPNQMTAAGESYAAGAAYQGQTLQLIQAQRDAQNKLYDEQILSLQKDKEATTNKQKQLDIDAKIKAVQDQKTKSDKTFGQLQSKALKNAGDLYTSAAKESHLWGQIQGNKNAVLSGSRTAIATKFTGDLKPLADALLAKTKALSSEKFEVQMNAVVAGGQLDLNSAISLLNMFGSDEKGMMKTLDTALKLHDPGKVQELISLTQGIGGKLGLDILVNLGGEKDPAKFQSEMDTLNLLTQLESKEINIKVFLQKKGNLESLSGLLDKIDTKVGKQGITLKVLQDVQKVDPNMPDLTGLMDDWQKYQDQPAAIQKSVLLTYTSIYKTIGTSEIAQWKKDHPETANQSDAVIQGEIAASLIPNKITAPITSNDPKPGPKDPGTKTIDQPLLDLNKRLRDVRNSSILATDSMKELSAALAKTGSKAVLDRFDGLTQRLLKLGKTQQFTDFLTSLDETELKKYGSRVTKKGINPLTGKKDKSLDVGAFVLNDRGKKFEAGYAKAIIGDYNTAQLKTSLAQQQEVTARTKLLAMGFKQADVQAMIADENYRTLIATGKVSDKELKINASLTEQARLQASINALYKGQTDAQQTTDNQKRIPEVVAMMQKAQVSAEGIRSAISDPAMLQQLIDGIDGFDTMAQDAKDQFAQTLKLINEIPDRKVIELVFTQSEAQRMKNGADAANTLFDAYKTIDEHTIKNAEGNTFASLQTQMDNLNNQAKVAQDSINLTQSKIDTMQQEVDKAQRDIETNFTRPIEARQRSIDKLNRNVEININRPIQALQDRSSLLSHDLEVMSHAADAINKKYDDQQTALQKVADINQQIIAQQQQQLGLADALTQGDIAAAAKAAQDMRASNAANYASNAQNALQQSRQNEIDALRGGVSGKSQKDIQEEQYQIGLQTYDLEQGKAAIDKQILGLQDEIYTLEQARLAAQDLIQIKTDAIAKIQYGTLLDQQNSLKTITDQTLELTYQSDKLALIIGQNDSNRIISGHTREEWKNIADEADAVEKLASGDLARALAAAETTSGNIKGDWTKIKEIYDAIKSKSTQITQYIKTEYGTAPADTGSTGSGDGSNKNTQDPAADQVAKDAAAKAAKDASDAHLASLASQGAGASGGFSPVVAAAMAKTAATTSVNTVQGTLNKLKSMGFMASGGLVPSYFAAGGFAKGTDTIPAMLTPGEFVMSRYAVNTHGVDTLRAMNSGTSAGDSVYNYNLSINVKSDSNPDDIARTVMAQIRQVDSQRIRGNRF